MKKDLTKLTQDLEELEKRIKAISTSCTTLAQIIAVRDSLDQLKTCFNELTTAIKEDDDDASLEQLNALSARVTVCETDILALQTDLSSTQEDLTTLQNDLSSTNSTVGEHSTTITNLQATQTSLQSAQTNMQTTISNQTNTLSTHTTDITSLKARMTTAENNISALTGGVDVGEIDERIKELETTLLDSYLAINDLTMFLTTNNGTSYSRIYTYKIDECDLVEESFTLKYTTSSNTEFNLKLFKNNKKVEEVNVDLSKYPTSYTLNREFIPSDNLQTYQFYITSSEEIKFTGLTTKILGRNPLIFDNDKDIKIECYNNNVYITKYTEANNIQVGYCHIDDFSLDNFSYSSISIPVGTNPRYAYFGPAIYGFSSKPKSDYNVFLYENDKNIFSYNLYNYNNTFKENGFSRNLGVSGLTTSGNFQYGSIFLIDNYLPSYIYAHNSSNSKNSLNDITSLLPGKFYFANLCKINYYITDESAYIPESNMKVVCVYQDNYVYLLINKSVSQAIKIAKAGKWQSGYIQTDGSINIYITRYQHTYKYNVKIENNNSIVSFVKKYTNCDHIYELNNNKIVIHNSTGWQLTDS